MALTPPGFAVVLSGPSGAGKTTLRTLLMARNPEMLYSVSATTRARRADEVDGQDYWYLSHATFAQWLQEGKFVESAEVHANAYGTPRGPIDAAIARGQIMLLDVDVQGGEKLREVYPDGVSIFVLPPSLETLESRLRGRKTEADEVVRGRLSRALGEIEQARNYKYVVVNEDVERALATISAIIDAERHKVRRLLAGAMPEFLAKMRGQSQKES